MFHLTMTFDTYARAFSKQVTPTTFPLAQIWSAQANIRTQVQSFGALFDRYENFI